MSAAVYDHDGNRRRAVSLEDVFGPVTTEDEIQAARNELDLDRQAGRYPAVNNDNIKINNRWVPSGRRDSVERQLRPLHEALGSERLDATDRQRIVDLGRNMMQIANDYPENVDHGAILDPEEARVMAHAENAGRQVSNGFLGRRRTQNEYNTSLAVHEAQRVYRDSLNSPSH